jgi:AcrR family transcriptional regulator
MASRRSRKKARTREAVLDAAAALLAREAFDSLTVGRICERADVAPATFFLHFPEKRALLFELARRLASEIQALPPADTASALYRATIDAILVRKGVAAAAIGAWLAEPARAPELGVAVAGRIQAAVQRGELRRKVAPELAARVLLASAAAALADAERPAETVRNELLHVLLHGMAEPKPRLKWKPTRAAFESAPRA